MRKGYLLWFFILICSQPFLDSLSLDEVHTLQNEDPKISKHPLVAQEKQATYSYGNDNLLPESDDENVVAKHLIIDSKKGQRGKGSNGGADVVHRRPNAKAAAPILGSPFDLFLLVILPHLLA